MEPGFTRIFRADELVPESWLDRRSDGFRTFNPTLIEVDGRVIMAYRVVSEALGRKIALCELDRRGDVVGGSIVPFSDLLRIDPTRYTPVTCDWHADPRLFALDGQPYIYWNDGYQRPHNNQFISAIDGRSLKPQGTPLRLDLDRDRQMIEKNWGLFFDDRVRALYGSNPHQIISLADRDARTLTFTRSHVPEPNPSPLGELRGGATPVLFQGEYYSFCHAVTFSDGKIRNYDAAVHTFATAEGGFAPRRRATAILRLPNPFGTGTLYPKLNPRAGYVTYICGAVRLASGWLLGYGINDEHCALHVLAQADVDRHLGPSERPA